MAAKTPIQWCDATFNIVWGCIKVSPGCENCYAATFAKRLGLDIWGPAKTTPRRTFGAKHWAEPLKWNRAAERAGERRRVFCSSMADIGEDHPTVAAELLKLWPLIRATPWLDWLLLTKRPERYTEILPDDWGEGYDNVWLGTSVESQSWLWRAEKLGAVRARVHFLSVEPQLGPLDLRGYLQKLIWRAGESRLWIDWVIVGGESGRRARPFNIRWAASIIEQCRSAGVAPFVKQLGAMPFDGGDQPIALVDSHGGDPEEWPPELRVREFPQVRA